MSQWGRPPRCCMAQHQMLLNEWIACRAPELEGHPKVDPGVLLERLRIIQDYLCSFESRGVAVVDVSATTFPKTLDWLHGYLLSCIEMECKSAYKEVC